ncbi:MAG: hypothetical protein HY744_16525 [Deltaproteobacteria bacterium]|nr:hypothetical protein [Deltaproteobacteria bacterium]
MRLGIRAGVETPLGVRLSILAAFRLVVLTLFLAVTELFYFEGGSVGGYSSRVAVVTVGLAYALAAAYAIRLRRGGNLTVVGHAQLVTDQLAWTAFVYISGGVTSGATSLYGLTCLSGAILLGPPGALSAGLAGLAGYLGLCAAFAGRLLLPPPDQTASAYVTAPSDMVYPGLSNVLAIAVVTMLAAYLAERLRATGGRLAAATARAEQAERLAALGRLAAGLAHEIRNPLGAIRGSIELLRTGAALTDEDRRLCQIVERATMRMNDLVGDMIHLTRPREPEAREMDLAAAVEEVLELARRSGRAAGRALRYEGPEKMPVLADRDQMHQVIWNLLRNAVEVSSAGGEVLVRLSRGASGEARVDVVDHGPGIAPENRERVFDAFFTTRSHGVGIGLAVVKQVADGHGFGVDFESEPGRGATFSVHIPARSVVAALVLALLAGSCAPASEWVRAAGDPPAPAHPQSWADLYPPEPSGRRPPPAAAAVPASASAAPAPAPSGTAPASPDSPDEGDEPVAIRMSGERRARVPAATPGAELFRNTYYDFPQEPEASPDQARRTLFDPSCRPIRVVGQTFHDRLCVQGSGRLASGQTVSFAKRHCACAAVCPRTGEQICFEALDPGRFPYGRGATGLPIAPLRTVAVDPAVVPLGTALYIPEYHGLRDLGGVAHDGCFVAEDRGLRVRGRHVDVFTGDPRLTTAWNAAVPSNAGVHVVPGAPRCAHLRKPLAIVR